MMSTQNQLKTNRLLRNRNIDRELEAQNKLKSIYRKNLILVNKELDNYHDKIKNDSSLDVVLFPLLYISISKIVDSMYRELSDYINENISDMVYDNYNTINSFTEKTFTPLSEVQKNVYLINPNVNKSVSTQLLEHKNELLMNLRSHLYDYVETGYTKRIISDIIYNRKGGKLSGDIARTARLYRTEFTRVRTLSKLDVIRTLKTSGYSVKRTWLYTWESINPREHHVESNGLSENNDGLFEINGLLTNGPGLFGVPSEDINCRCDTLITIADRGTDV